MSDIRLVPPTLQATESDPVSGPLDHIPLRDGSLDLLEDVLAAEYAIEKIINESLNQTNPEPPNKRRRENTAEDSSSENTSECLQFKPTHIYNERINEAPLKKVPILHLLSTKILVDFKLAELHVELLRRNKVNYDRLRKAERHRFMDSEIAKDRSAVLIDDFEYLNKLLHSGEILSKYLNNQRRSAVYLILGMLIESYNK